MSNTTFKVGDRIIYVGGVFGDRKGKFGKVTGLTGYKDMLKIQLDGEIATLTVYPKSLIHAGENDFD